MYYRGDRGLKIKGCCNQFRDQSPLGMFLSVQLELSYNIEG